MNTSGNDINQVSNNLLAFLKDKLGDTKIDYTSPPTRLQGGNETSIFHFKLKNVQPSLLRPLILRKFRKEHRSNHAIMEKNGVLVWTQTPIQNELLNIIYNYSKIRVKVPG